LGEADFEAPLELAQIGLGGDGVVDRVIDFGRDVLDHDCIGSNRSEPESWSNCLNQSQNSRIKWKLMFPFYAILLQAASLPIPAASNAGLTSGGRSSRYPEAGPLRALSI
jgi:hypothetical protein